MYSLVWKIIVLRRLKYFLSTFRLPDFNGHIDKKDHYAKLNTKRMNLTESYEFLDDLVLSD